MIETVKMSGLTIESSLRVENRLGLCDWPCCSKRKPWVNRDNLALVRLTGLEEILDTVDQICSVEFIVTRQLLISTDFSKLGNFSDSSRLASGDHHWRGRHHSHGCLRLQHELPLDALGVP